MGMFRVLWNSAFYSRVFGGRSGHDIGMDAPPVQASAVVGLGAGFLADWLMSRRGWRAARVRALMQTVATLGARFMETLASGSPSFTIFGW